MNMANNKLSEFGKMGAVSRWGVTTLSERFWRHVNRGSKEECWNWNPATKSRYPIFKLTGTFATSANRVAYKLAHGEIPDGLQVLHKCDNTQCCNPNHLFLGTAGDNALDCIQKGRKKTHIGPQKNPNPSFIWRGKKGDLHPSTVYSDSIVVKIKELFKPRKVTAFMLAKRFGLPYHTVRNLIYHRGKYPTKHQLPT